MHSDLGAVRGDLSVVKGRSIGAAPLVGLGLRRLLIEVGIDLMRDGVNMMPIPGSDGRSVNFGVTAAQALEDRKVDGFWANGMGAEAWRRDSCARCATRRRAKGLLQLHDAGVIVTTDRLIARDPETAAGTVRAVMATQAELKRDVPRATEVGRRLFPENEANLIVELIRRDLPFYDPAISKKFVADMTAFARSVGLLQGETTYDQVVAEQFRHLWTA